MVVVMMGFGTIPILAFYIIEFGAGGRAMGLLMATYAIMPVGFVISLMHRKPRERPQTE
jgi:hypothetical protein